MRKKVRERAIGRIGEKKPAPNFETRKAMKDVELAKGTKVKDSQELFSKLGI